jgi:lipopolysaccharide export system protein LptA
MLRFVTLLILLLAQVAFAEGELKPEPIRVTADRLEADNLAGRISFQGQVTAGYGDMLLRSEEMVLFVDQADRSILRIEAVGKVKMTQGARIASGNSAVFFNLDKKVVLSGDARLKEGENLLEGPEITILLDEERTLVGGQQGGRVNAVFHPPGANK